MLYQAKKPNALGFDALLSDIHMKLNAELGRYHQHVQARPADAIYLIVAGLGQHMQDSLHNYAIRFRRAHAAGTPLVVPRLAALLDDTAFRPLDDWLRQRQVDVDALQADVDELLEQVRQRALAEATGS